MCERYGKMGESETMKKTISILALLGAFALGIPPAIADNPTTSYFNAQTTIDNLDNDYGAGPAISPVPNVSTNSIVFTNNGAPVGSGLVIDSASGGTSPATGLVIDSEFRYNGNPYTMMHFGDARYHQHPSGYSGSGDAFGLIDTSYGGRSTSLPRTSGVGLLF